MWVTNRKSMKVNFATLCIGEKTILQIKNLLPVFLFPAETLWFGSSLAGYQWVSWCGRRVGDCLGARGAAGAGAVPLGFAPTQSPQVVWIRLTGVICFPASGFSALTDCWTQIWLFKAAFQGKEACSCHNFPIRSCCVQAGAAVVQRRKCSRSTVCCPGGNTRWALGFLFLCFLHLPDPSVRSSVCCLILYRGIYSYCESNPGS